MSNARKSIIYNFLYEFPNQIGEANTIGKECKLNLKKYKKFNKILFCGMGGSAIGGDLIRSYLSQAAKFPIIVNRDYTIPQFADKQTLIFISSYSGNTEETISAYNQARKRSAKLIIVGSNGKLEKLSRRDKILFIKVPSGFVPRQALGYLTIVPLAVICRLINLEIEGQINETINILKHLYNNFLSDYINDDNNIAKRLARKIYKKFVFIYSANLHFDTIALRWRGQLAENSKTLASTHLFPEMNHNEIVGWRNPKKLFKDFAVLNLQDKGDHPRVKLRMQITKDILKKDEDIEVIEIKSYGASLLARMFSLIYIGDFTSFYLANLYGMDPYPVKRIDFLKKQLRQK